MQNQRGNKFIQGSINFLVDKVENVAVLACNDNIGADASVHKELSLQLARRTMYDGAVLPNASLYSSTNICLICFKKYVKNSNIKKKNSKPNEKIQPLLYLAD